MKSGYFYGKEAERYFYVLEKLFKNKYNICTDECIGGDFGNGQETIYSK